MLYVVYNMTNHHFIFVCVVGHTRTYRPGSGHIVNASLHALVYFSPQCTCGIVECLQVSCTRCAF